MSLVAALPPMELGERLGRLQARLDGLGCDGILVSHLTNVRYLTGFTGSAGLLLVLADDAVLVTDGRYEEQAAGQMAEPDVRAKLRIGRTTEAQRTELAAAAAAARRLGLEADHVTWAEQRHYAESWFQEAELIPVTGAVEDLRARKDDGEVARIEAACGIADRALATIQPLLDDGLTEKSFAAELDAAMRHLGADDISFETIVASGPNGSRPHHQPGDREIEHGDLVVVDFGALVDGYHSDMTRTIPVGGLDALDDTQRRMLAVVTEAQAAGVEAVMPGVATESVDTACRRVIEAAGWGEAFVHGTGHGVGLDIHEEPRVSAACAATLAPGHIVTVEPGVYLPGIGGVRVEDTVVVTTAGCRPLTRAPKP